MDSYVFNIDCMDYMRECPDNFFDLAIADPPYGINVVGMAMGEGTGLKPKRDRFRGGKNRFKMIDMNTDWDKFPPTEDFFNELFRISKNQIIWGGNYFRLPPTRGIICWDKCQTFLNFSQWEMAWTSFDRPAVLIRISNRGFLSTEKGQKIHPTQKPVELYLQLLKLFAKPGYRIFDPMMGSQSSRIACYRRYDYVGCEIDKAFFESGCERYNRVCNGIYNVNGLQYKQLNMFENE